MSRYPRGPPIVGCDSSTLTFTTSTRFPKIPGTLRQPWGGHWESPIGMCDIKGLFLSIVLEHP